MGPTRKEILIGALLAFGLAGPRPQVESEEEQLWGNLDSLAHAYAKSMASLTSPQLEERKAIRRELQQRGYSDVLFNLIRQDPLSALLAYARVNAQIEWSIPHTTLTITIFPTVPAGSERRGEVLTRFSSPPVTIPLQDDWTYPADPWKKE